MISLKTEGFGSARRWGRISFAERDVLNSQPDEWLELASRCRWDGIILAASVGAAFYPSEVPLHPLAPGVERRDVFGAFAKAAKTKGLKVVAGIDPSTAPSLAYLSRPDWFFLGADGEPRRSSAPGGAFFACINASRYWEQIPLILSELIESYDVDGIFGANWRGYGSPGRSLDSLSGGSGAGEPCHCSACREKYRLQRDLELPRALDRSDPAYRRWMAWRIGCGEDVRAHWSDTLKLFRRDLFFVGDAALDPPVSAEAPLCEILTPDSAIGDAGVNGRLMSALSSGARPLQIIEVSPDGGALSRSSAETVRLLAEAVASGSAPCASFGSASPLDRRPEAALEAFFQKHAELDDRLGGPDAKSLATVAVIVSEKSRLFHPESDGEPFSASAKGFFSALASAGIPFDLLPDSQISNNRLKAYRVVVLPNVACLSQDQCDILWEFGSDGGGIVATFETSVYDETGAVKEDFGMTDRLGVKLMRPVPVSAPERDAFLAVATMHEALEGFEGTKALPWAGRYLTVELLMDHKIPLVAASASSRLAGKRAAGYQAPAMLLGPSGKGRVVYFPTEIDRACASEGHPDHRLLLLNAVKWAHKTPVPLRAEGPGEKEVFAREDGDGLIVHIVNRSGESSGSLRASTPLTRQSLRLKADKPYERAEFLISGGSVALEAQEGEILVALPEIETHEIVAIR
jgi:hypothetical protein